MNRFGHRVGVPRLAAFVAILAVFGLATALAGESSVAPDGPPSVLPTSSTRGLPPPQPTILACPNVQRQELVEAGTALIAGTDGWIFRMADLAGEYDLPPGTVAGLTRFVRAWAEKGTRVALVLLPPRGVLASSRVNLADPLARSFDPAAITAAYRVATSELASSGAIVPDLLAESTTAKLGERFYFRRDHHWTPDGAKLAMNAVISGLESPPSFTAIAYQNVLDKYRSLPGVIAATLQKECEYEAYPPERYPHFRSVRQDEVLSAETLLGDAPPAEVVLAGSSHANKGMEDLFNVGGWLRAATGTDVLNIGVDGGGFSTGLLNWMDSEAARKTPPKLLVWEMTGRVPEGMPNFFREALPTMWGECAGSGQSGHVTVGADDFPMFLAKTRVRARDAYVFLQTADPAFTEFRLTFETLDGKKEGIWIRRSTRIANSGRFFVSAPDSESVLRKVWIRGSTSAKIEVNTTLCVSPDAVPPP